MKEVKLNPQLQSDPKLVGGKTSRRHFLALSLLTMTGLAQPAALAGRMLEDKSGRRRCLVVLTLSGGNDGLNTVVPYGMGRYYDLRPKLAVKGETVLPLDGMVGLNPSMGELAALYKEGKLAVVQGVGYPEPNRSHFRSIEIWQTAQPDIIGDTGWLGRYLDLQDKSDLASRMLAAVNIDPVLPKSLLARKVTVPSVYDLGDFRFKVDSHYQNDRERQLSCFRDIYKDYQFKGALAGQLVKTGLAASAASEKLHKLTADAAAKSSAAYPDGRLSASLRLIAQMVAGQVGARVYTLQMDGFDTHANQSRTHNSLLGNLSRSLKAFLDDLESRGVADDVLVLVHSEFGRRAQENDGRGTDHGAAAPCFVLGKGVKGGLYGEHPELAANKLVQGDLGFKTDFRSVYAALLEDWLGSDARAILGRSFEKIPFV